ECLPAPNPIVFAGQLLRHAAGQYVIHLHTSGHNPKSWVASGACATSGILNGRKTVVSIGSGSAPDFAERAGTAMRTLIRATLGLMGAVICRNERTRGKLIDLGVAPAKISVLPGFYGVAGDDRGEIPGHIQGFLDRHSPVLAAMGSTEPEYGLPLVVEAATNLRARQPGLGLLLVGRVTSSLAGDVAGGNGNLMATGQLPHDVVLSIMRQVNVVVRATYFDGDASSVREALALGVTTVASDTD